MGLIEIGGPVIQPLVPFPKRPLSRSPAPSRRLLRRIAPVLAQYTSWSLIFSTVSDILDLTWSYTAHVGSISGSFVSDSERFPLGPLPVGVDPANVFVEKGIPVGHGMDFINVEVRSDVPEAASVWLLPLVLGTMAGMKYRWPWRGHSSSTASS